MALTLSLVPYSVSRIVPCIVQCQPHSAATAWSTDSELISSRLAIVVSLQLFIGQCICWSTSSCCLSPLFSAEASRKLSTAQFVEIVHHNHLALTALASAVTAAAKPPTSLGLDTAFHFYREMHYSASTVLRSHVVRPSVCLSRWSIRAT